MTVPDLSWTSLSALLEAQLRGDKHANLAFLRSGMWSQRLGRPHNTCSVIGGALGSVSNLGPQYFCRLLSSIQHPARMKG